MPRIQRLDLRGFRGVRKDVPLLFEGKSILLFGENGSGKSSFVDALEKLFTGKVSTLDGRAQGLSSDRHGPHIRSEGYPLRIAVTFDDPASTTFTQGSDPGSLPNEICRYVDSARENLYILRRRQVMEFIDSQPRERYGMLRPFLPLSGIEDMENALRTARERAEAAAQQTKQELNRLANQLRRELSLPGSSQALSEGDVTEVVSQALERVGHARIHHIRDLASAIHGLDDALAPFGDLTRQSRLSNVGRLLEQLCDTLFSPALSQFGPALETLRAHEAQEARVFYEAVLEQGIRWIQEENRRTCPLCENGIQPEEIVVRVRQRLEAMHQVLDLRRQAQQALEQVRQTVRSALDILERTTREVALMAKEDRGQLQEILGELSVVLREAGENVSADLRDLNVEGNRKLSQSMQRDSLVRQRLGAEQERLQHSLKSLPSADAAQGLLSVRNMIAHVMATWVELERVQQSVSECEQQAAVALSLHEDARTARKEEVQRIFDELSEDINRFYTTLHPDESHGGIRLEVREVGQGSANLKGNFYDRLDEDPRAYYSDAHLDTLGLSIFLALRRWFRKQLPGFDLLVLDDVLTSVDTNHAIRFSELLLQEFQDYQILLTTHDRIWFEHLRDIQARCRVANNFINKIIHKWTIDEGPDIREPEDERQELDRLISDGSAEQIATMSGRLLEHILQEMRYALRLGIQAKRGEQYEIGDLWPAFYATVKKNYPKLYERSRMTLEALDVRWPLRNWIGAHRNNWARNVPRNAAIELANSVLELFDLVFCGSCRRFITPSATPLGQLACRCGERIYPAAGMEAVQPKTREELIRETEGALRDARLDTNLYLTWKRAEAGREH